MIHALRLIAERKISQAIQNGELYVESWQGRPLPQEDNSHIPPDLLELRLTPGPGGRQVLEGNLRPVYPFSHIAPEEGADCIDEKELHRGCNVLSGSLLPGLRFRAGAFEGSDDRAVPREG